MVVIAPDEFGDYKIITHYDKEDITDIRDVEYKNLNSNNAFSMNICNDYDESYPDNISRKVLVSKADILNDNLKILKFYLRSKERNGCSEETIDNYRLHISTFLYTNIVALKDISAVDIYKYLDRYKLSHNISNNTLDNIRRVLNGFFNYLEEEDFILKSPCRKIHRIKGEEIIKAPFTEEAIELLRDICPTIRELALVDFLNSSGVRVGELIKLNRNDISLLTKEGIVFGKGGRERVIYFDAKAKVHLQKYLASRHDCNPALFVNSKAPYNRITKSGVEFIISELGRAAGVKNAYPHRFRRSLATRLLARGMPIEQVQKILGHKKIETTLIYAKVNSLDVKRNHERYCT